MRGKCVLVSTSTLHIVLCEPMQCYSQSMCLQEGSVAAEDGKIEVGDVVTHINGVIRAK